MESVAIFGQSKLLISADSGPIQLAGMTECGILGLYSVMAPEYRLPYRHGQMGWNAYGIMTNCPKAPCYPQMVGDHDYLWSYKVLEMQQTQGLSATIYNWCLNEEAPISCMKAISVDEVFTKAMELYRSQA
jgi:ADP-heptose:LPS heptosyltransferase